MPTCSVYGHNPSNGPSQLAAQAALNQAQTDHPGWAVTLQYDASTTTAKYTSAAATADELETYFTQRFPQSSYHVVAT